MIVSFVFGIIGILGLHTVNSEVHFSDIIVALIFGKAEINMASQIRMMILSIPIVIFQILYGNHIYCRYCTASVYYFTRYKNRVKWYLGECCKLYIKSLMYVISFLIGSISCCMAMGKVNSDNAFFVLIMQFIFIFSLWLFVSTLAINLVSIIKSSYFAVALVCTMQSLAIIQLSIFDKTLSIDSGNKLNIILFKTNPIAHLILFWHSSKNEYVNLFVNGLGIPFSFTSTYIYFGVVGIIMVFLGVLLVKKKDIIVINQEVGGS